MPRSFSWRMISRSRSVTAGWTIAFRSPRASESEKTILPSASYRSRRPNLRSPSHNGRRAASRSRYAIDRSPRRCDRDRPTRSPFPLRAPAPPCSFRSQPLQRDLSPSFRGNGSSINRRKQLIGSLSFRLPLPGGRQVLQAGVGESAGENRHGGGGESPPP